MKNEGKTILNNVVQLKCKINKIAFACDAGLGSSALGATAFSKKLKKKELITLMYYITLLNKFQMM